MQTNKFFIIKKLGIIEKNWATNPFYIVLPTETEKDSLA